jgi:hypothetical protein
MKRIAWWLFPRAIIRTLCYRGWGIDAAHGEGHVEAVRREARILAEKYAPEMRELVDEAARLHDIGNAICRETHEIVGAAVVATDPRMKQKWGKDLEVLVEAIREHRASTGNPQSVVARIISDADRLGGSNPLRRSMEYQLCKGLSKDRDEALLMAAVHVKKKYGPGGKGTRTYFQETAAKITATRQPIIDAAEKRDLRKLKELAGVE